jgi:hypothetical protein
MAALVPLVSDLLSVDRIPPPTQLKLCNFIKDATEVFLHGKKAVETEPAKTVTRKRSDSTSSEPGRYGPSIVTPIQVVKSSSRGLINGARPTVFAGDFPAPPPKPTNPEQVGHKAIRRASSSESPEGVASAAAPRPVSMFSGLTMGAPLQRAGDTT